MSGSSTRPKQVKSAVKATKLTDFFPRRSSEVGGSNSPSSPVGFPPPSSSSGPTSQKLTTRAKRDPATQKPENSRVATEKTDTRAHEIHDGKKMADGHSTRRWPKPAVASSSKLPASNDVDDNISTSFPTTTRANKSTPGSRSSSVYVEIVTSHHVSSTASSLTGVTSDSENDVGKDIDMPITTRSAAKKAAAAAPRVSKRKLVAEDNMSTPSKGGKAKNTTPKQAATRSSPRKKPRRSSSSPVRSYVKDELVPSSQSDEQELLPPVPTPLEDIDSGRGTAEGAAIDVNEDSAISDVETDDAAPDAHMFSSLSPPTRPSTSVGSLSSPVSSPDHIPSSPPLHTPRRSQAVRDPRTPPPISPPQRMDVTPAKIDSKTKTEMFLEDLRRRTRAEVVAEAEAEEAEEAERAKNRDKLLSDLDDSSDEEGWSPFANISKSHSTRSDRSDPSSPPQGTSGARSRGALSASTSPTLPTPANRPTRVRKEPVRQPALLVAPAAAAAAAAARKKPTNPIEALLKEKLRGEREGRGEEALRQAEAVDRDSLLSDMEAEEEGWLGDEDAARDAARRGIKMRALSQSGGEEGNSDEGRMLVSKEMRAKLLGEEHAEAVGKIMDADRADKKVVDVSVKGVRVWMADDWYEQDMADPVFPLWEAQEGDDHPLLLGLRQAAEMQDVLRLKRFMSPGMLRPANIGSRPHILRWLCELAVSDTFDHISINATLFLERVCESSPTPTEPPLSALFVGSTLARLDLKHDLVSLVSLNATLPEVVRCPDDRKVVIGRLMNLITIFARTELLDTSDFPGIFMATIIAGVDVEASAEQRDLAQTALDTICTQFPADIDGQLEVGIAATVYDFGAGLSTANQAHLLAMFVHSSERALRMSRRLAHHLATGLPFDPTTYFDLPPLNPVIDALGLHGPFEATNETDYDALAARVRVLTIALAGVDEYVALGDGGRVRASKTDGLRSPQKAPTKTPLEVVRERLDNLHGRIKDTRAAHLDRTRAKQVIQTLSMMIAHRRDAYKSELRAHRGPRRIDQFFKAPEGAGEPGEVEESSA